MRGSGAGTGDVEIKNEVDSEEFTEFEYKLCAEGQNAYINNLSVDYEVRDLCEDCIEKCDIYREWIKAKQIKSFEVALKNATKVPEKAEDVAQWQKRWEKLRPNIDAIKKRLPGSYGTKR